MQSITDFPPAVAEPVVTVPLQPDQEQRRAARTYIGVELDGKHLRAVSVADGRVQTWETVVGASPADAVRVWSSRARLSGAQVRIAWAGGIGFMRHQELADVPPDQQREQLLQVAVDTLGEEPAAAAGIAGQYAPPVSGEQGPTALLVTLQGPELDALWEIIGDRDWSVVPMVLVPQVDGLHVAVNIACVACYVVEGGIPRTYVELKTGGLEALADKVQMPPEDLIALRGNIGDLPDSATIIGYLKNVVTEVTTWARSWESNKQTGTPPSCWVHGPGADLGALSVVIADALGYRSQGTAIPRLNIVDHSAIPTPDWPQAYVATQAAQAVIPPLAVIPNPVVVAARAQAAARAQRAINMTGIVIAIAAVIGLLAVPIVLAWHQASNAANALRIAQLERSEVAYPLSVYQQVQQDSGVVSGIKAADPDVTWVQQMLASTAPPGANISGYNLQVMGAKMQVTAPAKISSSRPFSEIATWVLALDKAGATQVQPGTFNYSGGTITLTLQFVLPLQKPVVHPAGRVAVPAPVAHRITTPQVRHVPGGAHK
jgi:Tfp pilus assembly protein FimT